MTMTKITTLLAACIVFSSACVTGETDEIDQTIENLVEAGFDEADIQVYDDQVYVGHDIHVTLEASKEMVSGEEGTVIDLETIQYRTRNLVSRNIRNICINDVMNNGTLSAGLDRAINRYNNLGLTFRLKKGFLGCDAIITAVGTTGNGGSAGFPSFGRPYSTINIGHAIANLGVGVASHVIAHELGHTIGFRHSDFYNRSISCGSGGNEGDGGVGAIHIPGTPTNAVFNGSIMNSCFNNGSTGVFTGTDVSAFRTLY